MNVVALALAVMTAIVQPTTRELKWASQTQGEGFRYGPYPQCASGGWGAGKTWMYCLKALWLSTEYPKNRGVIARHVGKELRETTMATFYKVCPAHLYDKRRGGRRNDQNGYLRLSDVLSEILFIHLDNPETEGVIRGLEINWFLIDQAEENPEGMEELFDMLMGRLGRWDIAEVPARLIDAYEKDTHEAWPFRHPETDRPVPPPYPMLAVNPDQETHWVYRRFHPESQEHHDKSMPVIGPNGEPTGALESYADRGYKLFHMPSQENRFLGDTNKQFLFSHDDAFVRRNVHGIWGMPEGAIHSVDKRSLIPGSQDILEWIRQTCLLYRTLDHGDSSPTCCEWWGVDRDGNVFFYREYYKPNEIISKHRSTIAELSEHERYEQDLADPSIFFKLPDKKGGHWTVADEYSDVVEQPRTTAIFWQPADNNELGTRNRINEYLRVDPDRIHPITKDRGAPRLFFVTVTPDYPQGVFHALRETRAQRRVKVGTNLGKPVFSDERDPHVVDHAYDPVRYAIASRAPVPRAPKQAADGTFFGAKQRLAQLQRKRMGVR